MSDSLPCRVVRFHEPGGLEMLRLEHEQLQAPAPDEVQLRVTAIAFLAEPSSCCESLLHALAQGADREHDHDGRWRAGLI